MELVVEQLIKILVEKIREKVSKGKKLKFDELLVFFLSKIYIEIHKMSVELNSLAKALESLHKDISRLVAKFS